MKGDDADGTRYYTRMRNLSVMVCRMIRAFFVAIMLVVAMAVPSLAQQAMSSDYNAIAQPNATTNDPGQAGPEQYAVAAEELSVLTETQLNLEKVSKRLIDLIEHTPEIGTALNALLSAQSPTNEPSHFFGVLVWTLAFLGIAYLIEWRIYGIRLVGPWFISLQKPNPRDLVEKLPILALRAAIGVVGIAISMVIAGSLVLAFVDPMGDAPQKTVIIVMAAVAASRLTAILWRMVLAPYLPQYRIPCMSDPEARKLFNWLWLTMTACIALLAFCYWIEDIGASRLTHNTLTLLAMIAMVVINIALVLVNRNAISQAILGQCHVEDVTWLPRISAALWAPIIIIYFFGAAMVLSYRLLLGTVSGAPLIVGAYTVLLAVILVYGVVAFSIARLFRHRRVMMVERNRAEQGTSIGQPTIVEQAFIEGDPLSGDGDEDSGPATQSTTLPHAAATLTGMRDFEALAKRTASIFAFGAGIYALLHIWDFDYLLEDGGALDPIQDVVDICLIGYLIYHASRIWIDTRIQEEGGEEVEIEPGDEGGGASAASRLATLLPLFRNFLLFTISISVLVMVLLKMGINVAPLFAGAGVVGIAIGFGAQTLIRDILSGMFYLFDDAFRKGEYIDIALVKGTVEKISLRSFQLRHHLGALHTIPFGEITHLTNYSRDWVMVKLPIRVTYDTDVEKVRKLIKNLGVELSEHPIEGPKFLQPLKSQGIYKMEDSAMIIRVKFMTRPGDQWTTRKLVYSRLRELFAENGIKFAHREVTVRLSDQELQALPPDQRDAAAGAALTAVHAAELEALPNQRAIGDDR